MKKYTTNKIPAVILTLIGAFGWGLQAFATPEGFRLDFFAIILCGLLILILLDLLYGTYVTFRDGSVTYVESFFLKKVVSVDEIEYVHYQPTYGIAKEVGSLFVFKKGGGSAVFSMASMWFSEETLSAFAKELKSVNPRIELDSDAKALVERSQDYFEAQKVKPWPLALGTGGVVVGILLFIKFQSSVSSEFILYSNIFMALSVGLIAGSGTYALLRRAWLGLLIGILVSLVLLGVYWTTYGVAY